MRLIDIHEQHPPFDVPNGQGEALLATGTVKKYEPTILPKQHLTTWQVRQGDIVEDYQFSPVIAWSCSVCGPGGRISGPNSDKQKAYHPGGPTGGPVKPEAVPSDIGAEFIRLWKQWQKRFGKVRLEKIEKYSPQVKNGVELWPKAGTGLVTPVKR